MKRFLGILIAAMFLASGAYVSAATKSDDKTKMESETTEKKAEKTKGTKTKSEKTKGEKTDEKTKEMKK
jgi:hypothetical protein